MMFPRALTGRTVLVLLVAVTSVHVGSMLVYERGLNHIVAPSRDGDTRERLEAARNVLSKQSLTDRPMMAALLSSENFQLIWSPDSSGGGQPSATAGDLRPGPAEAEGIALLDDMTELKYRVLPTTHYGHASHATLLSTTVMVLGVIFVAVLTVRGIVAPLRRLARAADLIGHSTDLTPIAEQGPLEVRLVARAFNAMQERIRRLVMDRTLALAAVSHDLRTPITRLRLRAGFIADNDIQSQIDRDLDEMATMLASTLAYLSGQEDAEIPRPTDLPAMLETLVDAETDLGHVASYEGPAHLTITARAQSLKRAFANLITNAVIYGGSARVRLRFDENGAVVTIDDDGPGIPDKDISRVFDPFVRLEPSRNRGTGGVGLGLTIALRAVTNEGGSLVLTNNVGGGLTSRVELPASALARSEPQGRQKKDGPDHETPCVHGYGSGLAVGSALGNDEKHV